MSETERTGKRVTFPGFSLSLLLHLWEPPSLSQSPPKETHTERLKVEMAFDERDFIHCDSQEEWKMEVKSPQVQCQSSSSSSFTLLLLFFYSPSPLLLLFSLFSSVCFLPPLPLWFPVSQSDKGFLVLSSPCCSLFSSSSMIIKMLWEGRCVGKKEKGFPSTSSSWRSLPNIHPFHPSQSDSRLSREEDCVHREEEGKDYFVLKDRLLTPLMLQEDLHQSSTDIISGKTRTERHPSRSHVCRFHLSLHVKCIVNVQCLFSNPYYYRHHMEVYCYETMIEARIPLEQYCKWSSGWVRHSITSPSLLLDTSWWRRRQV